MKTPGEKRRGAGCTDDAGANDGDAANGHVCDMSLRRRRCQSGYPARVEEIAFTGSIEPRGVDRARKVGHEHAIVWNVERDGNFLHETGHYDLARQKTCCRAGAIDRVTARGSPRSIQ
jgi:hypothetical protein